MLDGAAGIGVTRVGRQLPAGTVTFLFTDIQGSTARLHELGEAGYATALAAHRGAIRDAFTAHDGLEVDTQGDAFLAVFRSAVQAVEAAIQAQRAHRGSPLIARMGIHTGIPILTDEGYVGLDLHRGARVMAAGHGGQILLSGAAVDAARPGLPQGVSIRELGQFRLKDLAEPQGLFQVVADGLAIEFPRPRTLEARPNNLPVQLTSLVGREDELATTLRLLGQHRIVTLMATGGTGKTRLALQAAAELLDDYPEGVWFVDLAPISDGSLVAGEVAAVLGIAETPSRNTLESLADGVRARRVLVILDNCEQVIGAAATTAQAMLRSGPGVRILATSREVLGIAGEATYRLPSLGVPDAGAPARQLLRYPSIQLCVERARSVRPDVELTGPSLAAIAEICRRLDGIPLAIELAAARSRGMSFPEIAARLDDRFRLLTGGARTLLPRQQTLQALVDWSYDLLDDQERRLFQRLSVFVSAFDLERAEAVCEDADLPRPEILDVLLRLVDKSLVITQVDDGAVTGTRYRILDTLRTYGGMRLAEGGPGEVVRWRRRHVDAYVALANAWMTEIRATGRVPGATTDLENVRAAIASAIELDPTVAVQLAGGVGNAFAHFGRASEGRDLIRAALDAAADAPPSWRAAALASLGRVLGPLGDYRGALAALETSRSHWRSVPDRAAEAMDTSMLALLHWEQGHLDEADAEWSAALRLYTDAGMAWGSRSVQSQLGLVKLSRQRPAEALPLFEQSAAEYRAIGDEQRTAGVLNNVAVAAERLDDLGRARAAAEEAVELCRRTADVTVLGIILLTLAHIERRQGELEAMRAHVIEALDTLHDAHVARGIIYALEYAAMIRGDLGDAEAAIELFGAASCARETIGSPLEPVDAVEVATALEQARAGTDPDLADAAWARGRATPLEAAVDRAVDLLRGTASR